MNKHLINKKKASTIQASFDKLMKVAKERNIDLYKRLQPCERTLRKQLATYLELENTSN